MACVMQLKHQEHCDHMSARISNAGAVAIFTLVVGAFTACDRTETSSTARVTTKSPAGESTAPSAAVADKRDEALVRVVHAIPASAPVDVYAGDLTVFDNLSYKAVTAYRALDGKRYTFAVRPAGMANAKPLSSNTEGLNDGDYYTVFALPGDGNAAHLRVVQDVMIPPPAGKARLRVIHGGADAGEIDIHATGIPTPLFDGVDFQAVTNYRDVDPVNGEIEIRAEGQEAPIAKVQIAHIEAGKFYTLVIVGRVRSTPKLEAFLIEDALNPGTTR
jgi:hypothetical protein